MIQKEKKATFTQTLQFLNPNNLYDCPLYYSFNFPICSKVFTIEKKQNKNTKQIQANKNTETSESLVTRHDRDGQERPETARLFDTQSLLGNLSVDSLGKARL